MKIMLLKQVFVPRVTIHILFYLSILFLHCKIISANYFSVFTNEKNTSKENFLDRGGIAWQDLSVGFRGSKSDFKILHASSGFIPAGHLCGIIGPSGSGKSTFLAALSGTTSKNSNLNVYGHVWMKGKEDQEDHFLSVSNGEVAMLRQEDVFFSMLTPHETLDLAAKLQLPSHIGRKERNLRIQKLLNSLGLDKPHVIHRRVGDRNFSGSRGGLSGGERRRLSVAMELITTPQILLADEPTTGLDSFQAEKVVALMKRVSEETQIPTICSLHQPRASIWKRLDSFILLAPGGRVAYVGSRQEAGDYFEKLGYKCPSDTNPAEYFIDLVSIDTEDEEQSKIDNRRVDFLVENFCRHAQNLQSRDTGNAHFVPPDKSNSNSHNKVSLKRREVGVFQRFIHLFIRSWRQNMRDIGLNALRFFASTGQALLFGQIFKSISKDTLTAKSMSDRIALLTYGVINMSMLALLKAIELFSKEKNVVTRERMRNQYSGAEYLLSKMMAEFPMDAAFAAIFAITLKSCTGLRCSLGVLASTYSLMTLAGASLGYAIGSLAPDADTAKTAGMPIMVVLMVVGIINPSGVDVNQTQPSFVRLLKLASPIKWAVEALCTAEFRGMKLDKPDKGLFRTIVSDAPKMGALALVQNGDQVLEAIGLANVTWESSMRGLAKLTCANLLIAFSGLTFCGPSFINASEYTPVIDEQTENDCSTSKDAISAEFVLSNEKKPATPNASSSSVLSPPVLRGPM